MPSWNGVITPKSPFCDDEFHSPILIATVFCAVVSYRYVLAVALGVHAVRRDTFLDQVVAHRLGAFLGQLQIERVVADGVSVALDLDLDLGVVLERLRD